MAWISEESINTSYLVPSETTSDYSDSDVDENVARIDFEREITNVPKAEPLPNVDKQNDEIPITNAKTNCKSSNVFRCHVCNLETSTRFNLKRHIRRCHGDEQVKGSEEGKCVCLECGHKCRYITHLRNHLVRCHSHIFRTEEIVFESSQGKKDR